MVKNMKSDYQITRKYKQAIDWSLYAIFIINIGALYILFPPVHTLAILLWCYCFIFCLLILYRPGWWLCGVVISICTLGFIPHLYGVFNADVIDGSIVSVHMFRKLKKSGLQGRVISLALLGLSPSMIIWWLREKQVMIPKVFLPMAAFGLLMVSSSIIVCLAYVQLSVYPPFLSVVTPDFVHDLTITRNWWRAGMPYSLMAFTIILSFSNIIGLFLFAIIYNILMKSYENMKMITWAMVVSTVITVAYGLMQVKGFVPAFSAAGRFESTFQSQGCYGIFVGISCVFFLSRLFLSKRYTLMNAALLLVSLGGLLINKSRTAFIAIVFSLFVVQAWDSLLRLKKEIFIVSGTRKALLVSLISGLLICLFVLIIPQINHTIARNLENQFIIRMVQTFDVDKGGVTYAFSDRIEIWGKSLDIWKKDPLWGCGYGQLYWELRKQKLGDTAANQFILVLAELGIVGLALFLWVLASLFRELVHPFSRAGGGKGYSEWLVWFCVVVSIIVQSLTVHILHFPNLPMLIWVAFSVAIVCSRKCDDGVRVNSL